MKSTVNNPEDSLPYHLRGAFRGFETALSRYLETVDLPLAYFHVLRLQWEDMGSSQSNIARKSFMTDSVASQVIKKMIADKLLCRERDPNDKRVWLVKLTPKGLKLREQIVAHGMKISKKHGIDISRDDAMTTIKVLKKIRKSFDLYNEEYSQDQS